MPTSGEGTQEVLHKQRICVDVANREGFTILADLIASLDTAERDISLRERIRYLCRASLLVVDEIGYLSVVLGDVDGFVSAGFTGRPLGDS